MRERARERMINLECVSQIKAILLCVCVLNYSMFIKIFFNIFKFKKSFFFLNEKNNNWNNKNKKSSDSHLYFFFKKKNKIRKYFKEF